VIGRPAPDLRFLDQDGNTVALTSLRGRPVVLVFLRWLG
jgi:peroxiredoxin